MRNKIGEITLSRPPGVTPCANGKFSTLPRGRGVCSRNGGFLFIDEAPAKQQTKNFYFIDPDSGRVIIKVEKEFYQSIPEDKKSWVRSYFKFDRRGPHWYSKAYKDITGPLAIAKKVLQLPEGSPADARQSASPKAAKKKQQPPKENICNTPFEDWFKSEVHKIAAERKADTKKALQNSDQSFTMTWYRQQLRHAYDFNYRWYSSDRAFRKAKENEYFEKCGGVVAAKKFQENIIGQYKDEKGNFLKVSPAGEYQVIIEGNLQGKKISFKTGYDSTGETVTTDKLNAFDFIEKAKKAKLSGIIKDPAQYTTLCNDGTYSSNTTNRACNWHGGVKQFNVKIRAGRPSLEAHPAAVYLVPINEVKFSRELFQNREADYSEESVQKIITAVKTGSFRFEVFDPVLLWKYNGRLIVLSGHSRTEAFKRLSDQGYNKFSRIPAKIIEASQKEAIKIARNSNTLQTKEKDTERARYYRDLRKETDAQTATEEARTNEGKDWRRIISYSYLNPSGKTFFTLRSMEGKDDTSQENIKNIANWIGNARQRFPQLSNLHEDEIFDWLAGGGFGRQYTRMSDFLNKVQSVIFQREEFGKLDPNRKLNFQNLAVMTATEKNYAAQKIELQQTIRMLDREIKEKLKDLNSRGASQADIDRIITPKEMQLRTARQKLIDFEQKATRSANNELSLFAVSGIRLRAI